MVQSDNGKRSFSSECMAYPLLYLYNGGLREFIATTNQHVLIVRSELSDELDTKVKKYLRGEGANLEALQDKKLKGQPAVREELYGKSAKAASKVEKWLLPSEEAIYRLKV